jgi:hypothetical protein
MRNFMSHGRLGLATLAVVGSAACAPAAHAAEFSLYLRCEGRVSSNGKSTPGRVDLALRDNNQTALVQQSNALPVGVRLKYDVSPAAYSMTYRVPGTGSAVLYDWWRGALFVWQPSLKMVATVRLSIDRQSGQLNGEMLNAEAVRLASLDMMCEALKEEELAPPKF